MNDGNDDDNENKSLGIKKERKENHTATWLPGWPTQVDINAHSFSSFVFFPPFSSINKKNAGAMYPFYF